MAEQEKVVINLGKRTVVLIMPEFDMDLDTEELTQIQHHNIMGEILTSSVLLNKIGNLKSEMENMVAEAELNFKIWQSHQEKKARVDLVTEETDSKGKTKLNRPTIPEVDGHILTLPDYKLKQMHLLQLKKDYNILNNFYWAVKSKDDKLVKLTEKLRPEEFQGEIAETRVNTVMIRVFKNLV